MTQTDFSYRALTTSTWDDFEEVMGGNGGAKGCWCMHWRVSFEEWEKGRGDGNRSALKKRVRKKSPPPGLIGYVDGKPAAWLAIADRSEYARLQRSPVTKAIDDEDAWVISCIYVHRDYRGQGLQAKMIDAACKYAKDQKQSLVEGFPVEPGDRKLGADSAMTGVASAFIANGFKEVARRKSDRPAMRKRL